MFRCVFSLAVSSDCYVNILEDSSSWVGSSYYFACEFTSVRCVKIGYVFIREFVPNEGSVNWVG